jgi:putative methyltransferase (TIGR04325 family)
MRLNDLIKLVTPPVFMHLAKRLRGNRPTGAYGLSGDFRSWAEAMAASTGYDSERILEMTTSSLLKVKSGEAAYERDSVLFDEIQYAWPVLAGLMWVAARCGGRLNVLDFGGSLGSTYFQNRAFLRSLSEVRWNVVEQPRHVEIGKKCFEDNSLRFYADIGDCLADTQPNVVLLSSVLQYLEHPYALLDQIQGLPCDHIIIDRTPFWDGPTDRLYVQSVPPSIYPASYPSWIFSKQRFALRIREDREIMVKFDNPDRLAGPVEFSYQGGIIVRSQHLS